MPCQGGQARLPKNFGPLQFVMCVPSIMHRLEVTQAVSTPHLHWYSCSLASRAFSGFWFAGLCFRQEVTRWG